MKKILTLTLCFVFILCTLIGCASSKSTDSYTVETGYYEEAVEGSYAYDDSGYYEETAPEEAYDNGTDLSGLDGSAVSTQTEDLASKIIYSASVHMETLEYDACTSGIPTLLEQYDAFLESSTVNGVDYDSTWNNYNVYRSASFTIRVPKENFDAMLGSFSELGNVTYSNVYSDNITSQYYDVQSRLNSYRTEETQLLEILSECDTVEDMITVQSRLSEVRYNIESLTTQLNNWDNEVNYSTIYLDITEVKDLTESTEEKTYWEKTWDSLVSVIEWLGQFFADFFVILVASIPIFVVLGIIAGIVLLIIFKSKKRKNKKKLIAAKQPDKDAEKEAAAPIVSNK